MNTHLLQKRNAIILCAAFFVAFTVFSIFKSSFQSIDMKINLWVPTIHTVAVIRVTEVISEAFDTIALAVATVVVASFLFIKNHKDQSLMLLAGVGGNAVLVAIIKAVTQVARPENQLLPGTGFSYPSGHVTGTIIFAGLIVYYAWLNLDNSNHTKVFSTTVFGLVVVLVCFDRIYLNVHWLSDVVGGCLFGAFWFSFCIIMHKHLKLADRFKFKEMTISQ